MDIVLLIGAMIVVGLIMGYVAGLIWKDNRPIGVRGDYIASVITAVVVGLIDWFIIPAMGFSQTLVWVGLIFEPALGCLLVLWIVRKAKE